MEYIILIILTILLAFLIFYLWKGKNELLWSILPNEVKQAYNLVDFLKNITNQTNNNDQTNKYIISSNENKTFYILITTVINIFLKV